MGENLVKERKYEKRGKPRRQKTSGRRVKRAETTNIDTFGNVFTTLNSNGAICMNLNNKEWTFS